VRCWLVPLVLLATPACRSEAPPVVRIEVELVSSVALDELRRDPHPGPCGGKESSFLVFLLGFSCFPPLYGPAGVEWR